MITHRPYPSDVSDAEWEFVVPYLCLLPEDAGQRVHNLRDVFDPLRWLVPSGAPWGYFPQDFPPRKRCPRQKPVGGGLRAAVRDTRRAALRRVQLPDAPQGRSAFRLEF